jgi:hypothetical protein
MSNNKKVYNIHQSVGQHPCKIAPIVKTYATVLENYTLVYEYVRIYYFSKYSKYAEALLINFARTPFLYGCPQV